MSKRFLTAMIAVLAASTASATTFTFSSNSSVSDTGDVNFGTQTDGNLYDFNTFAPSTVNGVSFDLSTNGQISLAYRLGPVTENETDVSTDEDDAGTMTFAWSMTAPGALAFSITSSGWTASAAGDSDTGTVTFANGQTLNFGTSGQITAHILWSETDLGATTANALSNTNAFNGSPNDSNDTDYAYVRFTLTQADAPPPQQGDVPEPSTFALLGAGLAGLGLVVRRRK